MRILSRDDILSLVDVAALIEPIAAAMRVVSAGGAELPLRTMTKLPGTKLPGRNALGIMPGAMRDPAVHGAKVLSLFPDNPKHGRSSHAGLFLMFDGATGLPCACLEAGELTALRTAAATAVATRELARADAATLAIIGCGEEAHSHLPAMRAVRRLGRVIVWGRDPAKAAAFARHHEIETAPSIEAALAPADIVCTTTNAAAAFLHPPMLHAGLHINAVGASTPAMQEIATDCVPMFRLFTDFLPSLEAQAAEVIDARGRGLIAVDHPIAEIGAVLSGIASGRGSAEEITCYRSLGVAAQDLAAAQFILARAERAQLGAVVTMS